MLKFGVCKPADQTRFQRFLRRGLTSATLLAEPPAFTQAHVDTFEKLMSQICLSNGVIRTTTSGRFTQLNVQIRDVLKTVFPSGSQIAVADCAVSTGITALEWLRDLETEYRVTFSASDQVLYLIEAREEKDRAHAYILEPDGAPIQYVSPPFVVSLVQPHSWIYPFNRLVQRSALARWNRFLRSQLRIPKAWNTDSEYTPSPPFRLRRLSLIHPAVMEAVGPNFRIREHSIFSPLPEPVDVLRTMNILNRAYFSENELRTAIGAIYESVKPGGVWLVGRTVKENMATHSATVFHRGSRGWRVLSRIGDGSEIDTLVIGSD